MVAPLVGAWIEISIATCTFDKPNSSHPSWVRGLKFSISYFSLSIFLVAPLVGAWIEIILWLPKYIAATLSHPSWVRGLKSTHTGKVPGLITSHPSWVRGLKF